MVLPAWSLGSAVWNLRYSKKKKKFTFLIWLLPILSDNSNRALHMQNPWGRDLQTPGVRCQIYFFKKHSHSLLVVPAHIWVCASPFSFCAVGQLLNIISLKLIWFIVNLYLSYGFSVYHLKALTFCNIKQTLCQVDFRDKWKALLIVFI